MSLSAKVRQLASVILFLLVVLFGPSSRQMAQNTTISEFLVQLRSEDWQRRSEALERILAIPEALKTDEVRKGLVDLLDKENRRVDEALRESNGREGASVKYGEGYSEYYASLFGAVTTFEGNNRALRVLARSSFNPGSAIARRLAEHWDVIGPVMLDLIQSDIALRRNNAFGVLTNIIKGPQITRDLQMTLRPGVDNRISSWRTSNSRRLDAAFGASDISESEKERLIGRVEPVIQQNSREWADWVLDTAGAEDFKAKKDQEVMARLQTVRVLGLVGNKNTILLLERIASSDPETTVKLEARKAIAAIRDRQGNPSEAPR